MEATVQNNIDVNMLQEASLEEQIEVLKTLFTVYYVKYHIEGGEEDKLRVWSIINTWIDTLGPVKYDPGILDIVSRTVRYNIWDKPIPVDIIEELIEKSIRLRRGEEYESFLENLSEFLTHLSGSEESRDLVKKVCIIDRDCLLTMAVQALVLASNI